MTDEKAQEAAPSDTDTQVEVEETQQERTQPTSTRRSPLRYFWYLVLVVIIATIAWIVVEKPYKNINLDFSDEPSAPAFDAQASIEEMRQEFANKVQSLSARLEQAQQTQSRQQQAANQSVATQLDQLTQQLSAQRQQLQQLSNQLPEQQFQQLRYWRLFEAKQTVSAAARLLWTTQDYPTAVRLLRLADQQVAGIETAQALRIRELLASDIARVEGYIEQQPDQIALTLTGLQERINNLPNRIDQRQRRQQSAQTVSSEAADWQQNLAANWNAFLDSFIRIQRNAEEAEPLLDDAQRDAIEQRLNLLLTMAQHAVLTENATLWRQYIDQSLPLITTLKGNTDAVQDVVARLQNLRSASWQAASELRIASLGALAEAVEQGVAQ